MHELLLVEDDDALGRGIRLALEGGGRLFLYRFQMSAS